MENPASSQMKRLNLLNSELDAVYHEATLKLGLTDSAMIVLYTMCMFDGSCLLSQIIQLSGLSKQTVNSALRKLEAEGVLYLEAQVGRKKRACLTEKGRELAQGTALRLMAAENEVFSSWPAGDQETYLRLTQRFLAGLREKIKELEAPGSMKK